LQSTAYKSPVVKDDHEDIKTVKNLCAICISVAFLGDGSMPWHPALKVQKMKDPFYF